MAVTAVLPGLFPTALLRDIAVAASPREDAAQPTSRTPDAIVFSSAPFRALAELAATGLRQLATLLPAIEQAVEDHSLEPLAHLAKAAGTAARQVADGHVALLAAGPDRVTAALAGALPVRATPQSDTLLRTLVRQIGTSSEPAIELRPSDTLRAAARQIGAAAMERPPLDMGETTAEPAQLWLTEAKHLLHRTGDALDQANALLPLNPAGSLQGTPSPAALAIIAAQLQIASTVAGLIQLPRSLSPAATPSRFTLNRLSGQLSGAASVIGALVLLTIMSLTSGLWSICIGLLGLTGTAIWIWRIGRAARGVTLDVAR